VLPVRLTCWSSLPAIKSPDLEAEIAIRAQMVVSVARIQPIGRGWSEPIRSGRRAGASVRRAALLSGDIVRRRGLATTSALRTMVDLAGGYSLTEGVVAADLVLHAGLVTIADLRTYVAERPRAKGIARLHRGIPP
jgi:hypothetical protein